MLLFARWKLTSFALLLEIFGRAKFEKCQTCCAIRLASDIFWKRGRRNSCPLAKSHSHGGSWRHRELKNIGKLSPQLGIFSKGKLWIMRDAWVRSDKQRQRCSSSPSNQMHARLQDNITWLLRRHIFFAKIVPQPSFSYRIEALFVVFVGCGFVDEAKKWVSFGKVGEFAQIIVEGWWIQCAYTSKLQAVHSLWIFSGGGVFPMPQGSRKSEVSFCAQLLVRHSCLYLEHLQSYDRLQFSQLWQSPKIAGKLLVETSLKNISCSLSRTASHAAGSKIRSVGKVKKEENLSTFNFLCGQVRQQF